MGIVSQALQQDRHPLSGEKFANLFALRQAKQTGLLSYLQRDCACILIRMEEAQTAPEATADRLLASLGQPARDRPFRSVVKQLGSKFKASENNRPDAPTSMSADDLAFLNANLDIKTETRLGYAYQTSL